MSVRVCFMPCNIFETAAACLFPEDRGEIGQSFGPIGDSPHNATNLVQTSQKNMKENKRKQKAKKERERNFDIPFRLINKAKGEREKG